MEAHPTSQQTLGILLQVLCDNSCPHTSTKEMIEIIGAVSTKLQTPIAAKTKHIHPVPSGKNVHMDVRLRIHEICHAQSPRATPAGTFETQSNVRGEN